MADIVTNTLQIGNDNLILRDADAQEKITGLKEDLKSTDLSAISQGIANNKIVITGNWERGVLLISDGSEYKNDRYIRTGWLKRQEGIDTIYLSVLSIFPNSEGKGQVIRLMQYDANKTFISLSSRSAVGVTKVTLNNATKYLRLSIGVESYPIATIPFEIKECFEVYAIYTASQTLEGKMSYLPLLSTSIGYGEYVQGARYPDGHIEDDASRIASVFVPVNTNSIIEIYSPNLYFAPRIYATDADDGTNSQIYTTGWQSPSIDKTIIEIAKIAPTVEAAYFAINLAKNSTQYVDAITPEDATGCYVKVYDKPVELALTAEQKNTIMRSLITLHYTHNGNGIYGRLDTRNAITKHIYVPFPVTITAEAGYRFAYQTYDAPEYGTEHLITASPWYTNRSYTIPAYTYFCVIFATTDDQVTTEETNNHFTFTWEDDFVSEHYDALRDRDGGLHLSLGDAIRYQKESDLTGAKYYNGEKIHLSKHYYKQTTLSITIPAKDGKVRQASALFNNTLFQFYNSDYCVVIDYTTGELLGEFAVTCGHANSAGFTDVYAEQSDAFPLLFVADWTADTNTVWLYRITTTSATLYATWIFPASECGHYTGFAYNNGKLYGTGYYGTTSSEWYQDATNTIISTYVVNKADMTSTPVFKESFLIDYFPIRQDSTSDGAYNIFSSGWGGDYPSQIVFVDMFSKRITNVLSGLSGNLAGEHEGVAIYNGKLVITDVNGGITELTFDF